MQNYPFYYIPLTFILSPDYGGEDKGEGSNVMVIFVPLFT